MKVCVFGLWHLGTVTAACLADAGHDVVGLDPEESIISNLNRAEPPLFEPGLQTLLRDVMARGHILFTTDVEDALCDAEVVWVTFDTPVDEDDIADTGYVIEHVESVFPYLQDGTVMLISSQLPVGTAKQIEDGYAQSGFDRDVSFAVSPENLRLGKAIEVFKNPDRVVVGVRDDETRDTITTLLLPITDKIEWMSVESAEMTKHALNAFLATSVAFANEIATLCERVGANAKEVERGLKTEPRIGQKAYVAPGAAFSGGTLARDIAFLGGLAEQYEISLPLVEAVPESNTLHKLWAVRRLGEIIAPRHMSEITVTLLGLTYKPDTDTLRRSLAIEIAQQLHTLGAAVHAHDPNVKHLPEALSVMIEVHPTAAQALAPADVVVLATPWIGYKELEPSLFAGKVVLDASGFLRDAIGRVDGLDYYSVGKS